MRATVRRAILGPLLALTTAGVVGFATPAAADTEIVSAPVKTSSGWLNVRSGPSTSTTVLTVIPSQTVVSIACQVTGQSVRGTFRRTRQWDRLVNGAFITHAYVNTNATIRSCSAAGAPPPPPPPPAPASGPNSTMGTAAFIAASVAPAQASQREFRVPASVTIAQAILESGWGRSALSANDLNFFGMKCFSQGTIAVGCHTYRTTECNPDATCYQTTASFRVYASALDSFRDHGRLLATAPRYAAAFAYSGDPNQFIVEVHKGGYATSPTYADNIQRVMQAYNLYQYDLH